MKRDALRYVVSILLMVSITITGLLGYIQSELELRKFVPHRYFAYTTLSLAAIHVYLNFDKIVRFIRRFLKGKQ